MHIRVVPGSGRKLDISLNEHVLHTDLSKEKGGEGSAPNPYQLFLISIAACGAMYAVRFCEKRELPLDGLSIDAVPEYTDNGKRLDRFQINVQLPHQFPDKYRKALVRAIDLCTVTRAINDPPTFDIALVDPC